MKGAGAMVKTHPNTILCRQCNLSISRSSYKLAQAKTHFCNRKCSTTYWRDIPARFWEQVEKRTEAECWLWTGVLQQGQYGVFNSSFLSDYLPQRSTRSCSAHRMAYILQYGAIDERLLVCHVCDVRPCVNPAHLFLGTHRDNSRDMVRKGRSARAERNGRTTSPDSFGVGENHPTSKLKNADILPIILRYYHGGVSYKQLGVEYGVTADAICNVINGKLKSWAAVAIEHLARHVLVLECAGEPLRRADGSALLLPRAGEYL
jgi:hypothetical protein